MFIFLIYTGYRLLLIQILLLDKFYDSVLVRGIKEVCLFAAVIRYYAAKQILCNIYVISETTGYTSEHKISLSPSGADYGPTLTQRNQI